MARKFECIKSWPRQKVGDIVMEWEWRRFPQDIQQACFKELVVSKKIETKKTETKAAAASPFLNVANTTSTVKKTTE